MNIKLKLEGYLKGGYPVNEEDIDMISELDFYDELIDLISNSEEEEAIDLADFFSFFFSYYFLYFWIFFVVTHYLTSLETRSLSIFLLYRVPFFFSCPSFVCRSRASLHFSKL